MMNRSATACGVTDAGWSGLRSSGYRASPLIASTIASPSGKPATIDA